MRFIFFLFKEAGNEVVLFHHDDGVGDAGAEDILVINKKFFSRNLPNLNSKLKYFVENQKIMFVRLM